MTGPIIRGAAMVGRGACGKAASGSRDKGTAKRAEKMNTANEILICCAGEN